MKPAPPGTPGWLDEVKFLAVDLGLLEYQKSLALQKSIVEKRIKKTLVESILLVVEHPAVFTLGKRGGRQYLLAEEKQLATQNIQVVETSRGGVITYHGPGQLVVYPILRLRDTGRNLADFVRLLEEIMICIGRSFGVDLARDSRNAGVWHGESKVGSIGIAMRKGITYHGMALNVAMDLTPFSWITPCGLASVPMASLEQLSQKPVNMAEAKQQMYECFTRLLGTEINICSLDQLFAGGAR